MTGEAELERRYRRLLRWYPPRFRQEHEAEMLVVLMACARSGRRRPGPADSVNLIANALRMRGRLRAPRSTPTVFWAVRLMMLGAVLELAALVTVLSTRGDLAAAIARHYPAMPVAHVHHLVHVQLLQIAVGAPLAAGVWLWLAWSNDRGHGWARGMFAGLFALTSVSLFAAIGQNAVTLAPADLIAGGALWLIALVALALITSQRSGGHYGRRRDARGGRGPRPLLPVSASWN